MALANCKKCSKIYEKRLSDLCPVCLEVDEENFRNLYRRLQKSASQGGIPITELANEVGVSVEEIEQIYLDGRFGTAGAMLKVPCINCSIMVGATQRKGRFCNACSEKTAQKAGVEIKSKQALEKEKQEELLREQQAGLLRKNRPGR